MRYSNDTRSSSECNGTVGRLLRGVPRSPVAEIEAHHAIVRVLDDSQNPTDLFLVLDGDADTGAASVLVCTITGWHEVVKLTRSDDEPTDGPDWFGSSVAISGDTIVVGAILDCKKGHDAIAWEAATHRRGSICGPSAGESASALQFARWWPETYEDGGGS